MKGENKYTTKQRLLDYLNFKGEKKPSFYQKTGLSNGFLDKNDNINSDKIEIIISIFSDLSAEWLITGRGNMLKSDENMSNSPVERNRKSCPQPSLLPVSSIDTDSLMQVVREQSATIREQSATIREQSATIREITKLVGEAQEEAKKIVVPKGVRAISVTAG